MNEENLLIRLDERFAGLADQVETGFDAVHGRLAGLDSRVTTIEQHQATDIAVEEALKKVAEAERPSVGQRRQWSGTVLAAVIGAIARLVGVVITAAVTFAVNGGPT